MSDHVPTPYTPGDAYGQEGPGSLDRDSRVVRPNDPYAPKSKITPVAPSRAAAKAALRQQDANNAFAAPKGPFGTGASGFGMGDHGFTRTHEPEEAGIGDATQLGVYGVPPTRPASIPANPSTPQPRKGSVAPPGLG